MERFDEVVSEGAKPVRRAHVARHWIARLERPLRVPPLDIRLFNAMLSALAPATGKSSAIATRAELGSTLIKGTLALRAAVDPQLRSLYVEGSRLGLSRGSLLNELLKFYLLRLAFQRKLSTVEDFTVGSTFEGSTGMLRFVSYPRGGTETFNGSSRNVQATVEIGQIDAIEWDHSSLGTAVTLNKPRIAIWIGAEGFKRFPLLLEIGRRKPALLERALASMITSH